MIYFDSNDEMIFDYELSDDDKNNNSSTKLRKYMKVDLNATELVINQKKFSRRVKKIKD